MNRLTYPTPEMIAAAIAHRVCIGQEHEPANGKVHGCCVVCGDPWPCETAKQFLPNAQHQARRDSGVALNAVVGLLPVGLIPIPPMILQEANRRAMERGDLTFGHGIVVGLALCATWGLCAAAIWIKRAIVRRIREANKMMSTGAYKRGRHT